MALGRSPSRAPAAVAASPCRARVRPRRARRVRMLPTMVGQLGAEHRDAELVRSLLAGDELAFRDLVRRLHGPLVRVARRYVASDAAAEEVAQDTWLAVIDGLDRFEGRASLKTWIFTILVNQARTKGRREARSVPVSSVVTDDGPVVDPDRFLDASQEDPGHWASPPRHPATLPEDVVENAETRVALRAAVDTLPAAQQRVIWLRDVEGLSSSEVCDLLGLTEGNQRVLLHRARAKVRAALERRWEEGL